MIRISPSLLSADFTNLQRDIQSLEEGGADLLHMDIMDGTFVPNITFGPDQLKQMRRCSSLPFDVHLMIENPDRYVERFIAAGSDILTVHIEATKHLQRTLSLIKSFNVKAGVSLNPATPLTNLEYVLDDVDMILLMSVNPGFGGQKFIPVITQKVKKLKEMIKERNILIEVDGGINPKTAKLVSNAGADILVAGSYIFNGNNGNICENIHNLKSIAV